MANCGTVAGYHAHWRKSKDETGTGKVECVECLVAMADDKKEKRRDAEARAASSFEEAINDEPEIEPGLDLLKELRSAYRVLKAALRVPKTTRDVAGIAKQYVDLAERIAELEMEQNKSGGVLGGFEDELANVLRPDFEGRTGT